MSETKKTKKKTDDIVTDEPQGALGLEVHVIELAGLMIKDPIVRETVGWIAAYPMMALLRKDGKPIQTTDIKDLVAIGDLGLRARVGVMVLCATALRIMREEPITMEAITVKQSIIDTYACSASGTGFEPRPGSVMQYIDQMNLINN